MNLLHTLLAFVVALGTLVVIHELGHYLAARLCGVKVLRFSVGMGRVMYSRRFGRDQTEWAISLLPLGGYVKMLDAREQDPATMSAEDLSREFTRQSVWRRIVIVAAGPAANFLFAIVLFAALFMHGIPEPIAKLRAMPEQSVAYQAGLRGGETITAINDVPVPSWSELRWQLMQLALEKTPARLSVEAINHGFNGGKLLSNAVISFDTLSEQDLEGDFMAKLGLTLARPPAMLGKIMDGPAKQAGLQTGDLILAVNGAPIKDGLALVELIRAAPGKTLLLHVLRGKNQLDVSVTPDSFSENGHSVGRIKVEVPLAPEMVVVSDDPWAALVKGAQKT